MLVVGPSQRTRGCVVGDRPNQHQRSHYTVDDALTPQMTWRILHLFPFWLGTSFTGATNVTVTGIVSGSAFTSCYIHVLYTYINYLF